MQFDRFKTYTEMGKEDGPSIRNSNPNNCDSIGEEDQSNFDCFRKTDKGP